MGGYAHRAPIRPIWLADLIEATEAMAASAGTCDPAEFNRRLEMRAVVRTQRGSVQVCIAS